MARMAKKKKKNYRLRKSVRRTLGALFMISAIIVAAIPFPDAAATGELPVDNEEQNGGEDDDLDVLTYDVIAPTYDGEGYLTDTRGDFDIDINSNIKGGKNVLRGPSNQNEYDPTTEEGKKGAIHSAYNMRFSSKENIWYYQLQFQYYLNGNEAILYRYNNEYVEENV